MARMPAGRPQRVVHLVCELAEPARVAATPDDYHNLLGTLRRHAVVQSCVVHAWALLPQRLEMMLSVLGRGCPTTLLERALEEHAHHWQQEYCQPLRRDLASLHTSAVRGGLPAVLGAMRAVELAPVRAGRAHSPESWAWSSARWHMFGEPEGLVIDHLAYVRLGIDAQTRCYVYTEAMRSDYPDPVFAALRSVLDARQRARAALAAARDEGAAHQGG
jgi:putative transposase